MLLAWFWEAACFDHQYHLMSLGIIFSVSDNLAPIFELYDSKYASCYKYYGDLCCILHAWRDNASNIFTAWTNRFSAACAFENPCSAPPAQWTMGQKTSMRKVLGLDATDDGNGCFYEGDDEQILLH